MKTHTGINSDQCVHVTKLGGRGLPVTLENTLHPKQKVLVKKISSQEPTTAVGAFQNSPERQRFHDLV